MYFQMFQMYQMYFFISLTVHMKTNNIAENTQQISQIKWNNYIN